MIPNPTAPRNRKGAFCQTRCDWGSRIHSWGMRPMALSCSQRERQPPSGTGESIPSPWGKVAFRFRKGRNLPRHERVRVQDGSARGAESAPAASTAGGVRAASAARATRTVPRSWSSGAGGSRSRATVGPAPNGPAPPRSRQARPSRARRAMDPRRLGRDKRDPPVPGAQWTRASSVATSATLPCAVSAGLPCGAVVGADVLGGPCVRWRFRVRAAPPSVATSATLPCPAPNGPAPPRSRQARPSRTRRAMDPRRLGRDKRDPPVPGAQWTRAALGRDKRDPPVPGAQWTRAASVATSATLPCAVSAGLPCGAVVGADVLGGPCVRWRFRVRAGPQSDVPCRASPSAHRKFFWYNALPFRGACFVHATFHFPCLSRPGGLCRRRRR